MEKKPIKFRVSVLVAYMTAGALLWSGYIAFFDSVPPKRELIGEAAYRRAWTLIPLVAALLAAWAYLLPVALTNWQANKQFSVRALLVVMTLVAVGLGALVYAMK